jgi:hypothetical protein
MNGLVENVRLGRFDVGVVVGGGYVYVLRSWLLGGSIDRSLK